MTVNFDQYSNVIKLPFEKQIEKFLQYLDYSALTK